MNRRAPITPHWKEDFPIRVGEDSYITRREFTKFLGLISFAFLAGTVLAAAKRMFRPRVTNELIVADANEIAVGGYKLFRVADEPCILLRLDDEKFVAYSQHCTHLNCPVHFAAAKRELVCPCHEGHFSAEDGRVLAGPPKRPLTKFAVSVRDGKVWILPPEASAT